MSVAVLLVAACSPAPVPSASFTPPPEPTDAATWVDLVWAPASLPSTPFDVESEAIVAVDAGRDGFVAVGFHETEGVRDGAIWFSPDGSTWSEAGDSTILADVELLDVAAASDGFVALGLATGAIDDRFQTVFLRSDDGLAWERLPATAGSLDTFPSALAAGPAGVLAVGDAADGGPAVWFSSDGHAFERAAVSGPAVDGVLDPHAGQTGFVALGSDVEVPTVMRTADGVTWTATAVETAPDLTADHLVVGRWGYVVLGEYATACVDTSACGSQPVAWWSGDGLTWGRLPAAGTPTSNGASIVVPAGDRGLVAVDGASAWSSADGWRWTPLPEPGDGSIAVNDAVVERGVIVAVGQVDREDGSSVGRIIVGEQDGQ